LSHRIWCVGQRACGCGGGLQNIDLLLQSQILTYLSFQIGLVILR
jgi:hypothetical protein